MTRHRIPTWLKRGAFVLAFVAMLAGACGLAFSWRGSDATAVAKTAMYEKSTPSGMDVADGRTTYFQPGDRVVYKVVFKQTTPKVRATNVHVTDDLPKGLTFAWGGVRVLEDESHLTTPGTFESIYSSMNYEPAGGNHFDFIVDSMSENDYITCEVTATVAVECPAEQINIVHAVGEGSDDYGPVAETGFGKTKPVEDDEKIEVVHPTIEIQKDVDREWVQSTDELTYTITVRQTTPNAALNPTKIEDTLPEGVSFSKFISITKGGEDWLNKHNPSEWAQQVAPSDEPGDSTYRGFAVMVDRLEYGEDFVIKVLCTVDDGVHGGILDNVVTATPTHNPGTDPVEDDAEVPAVQPVLKLEKVDDANPFAHRKDTVNYTITCEQTAEHAEAREFWMEDVLPEGVTFTGADALTITRTKAGAEAAPAADAHASYDEAARKWRIDFDEPLAFGEVVTVTYPVTVDEDATYDFHTNTVTAGAHDTDTQEDDEPFYVPEPGLHILKTVDDDGYVQTGDRIPYEVTFYNDGANSEGKDIHVTDTPPEGIEPDFETLTVEGLDDIDYELTAPDENGGWTIDIPSMPMGTYVTVRYEATVTRTGDAEGELTNVATISDADGNHDEATTTVVYSSPDLSITKVIENAQPPIERGESFDYVIDVTNVDEKLPARNVVTTDKLPTGVRADGTPTMSHPDGTEVEGAQIEFGDFGIRWSVPELAPGEVVRVRIQAHVADDAPEGGIVNWARTQGDNVYWEDGDPDVERLDTDGNPVPPGTPGSSLFKRDSADISTYEPAIAIEKTHDGGPFHKGDLVTYHVKVTETTPDASAKDVVVTDVIPEGLVLAGGLQIDGVEGAVWEATESGYVVRIPVLADTDTCTITYQAQVSRDLEEVPADLTNVVSAVAQGVPRVTDDDTVQVVVKPNPSPDLAIVKTADVDEVNEGGLILYTVDLTETVADTSATNVTITDEVPEELVLWHSGMNQRLARATREALGDAAARLVEPRAWMTSKGEERELECTVRDGQTLVVNVGTLGYGDHAYLQFICVADDVDADDVVTNVARGVSPSVPHDVSDDVAVRILDVEEEPVVPDPVEPNPPANEDVNQPPTNPQEVMQDALNEYTTPVVSKLAQTGLPALGIGLVSCAAIAVAVLIGRKALSHRGRE